jgi:transposase
MDGIVPYVRYSDKERLCKQMRQCQCSTTKTRYLVIMNLLGGRAPADTARALGVHVSTVYRTAARFREHGEFGLVDRREENGQEKLDEVYLAKLYKVVRGSPQDYGHRRPTWTRELLVLVMKKLTGITIHVSTMSRALKQIHARRGRPKPTVRCPWSDAEKNRRLRAIRRLLAGLGQDEVAVYEDEVDIHLNPKIGLDWMVEGQQKEVETPGQNEKRYLAGAKDARTGKIIWVEGDRKNSLLFVRLLWELTQQYPKATKIHVILDNYSIHSTELVKISLMTVNGRRIKLHYLPPYCPDHNKIERVWEDLHANVTRNHRCQTMSQLMCEVRAYLRRRNQHNQQQYATAA